MSEKKNNEHESMDIVDNPGKYTFQRIKEAQDYLRGHDDALASIKKPESINWLDAKQKYLEHLINTYDHSYLALFEWLENNYSVISIPVTETEQKYQQCPECYNSDKNCNWCNGEGILPIN